jgi:predicted MFS family arabinose efflux permease
MMPKPAAACWWPWCSFAIALGAAAGGWVFDASGYQATFSLSAGVLFVGALLAFAAWLGVARPRLLATEG